MGGVNAGDGTVMIRGLAESWPPHRLAYAPALLPDGEKNSPHCLIFLKSYRRF